MNINIEDDLNLDIIVNSGQCFRPLKTGENSWRFITGDELINIIKLEEGSYDIDTDEKTWDITWKKYFDLNRSYADIRKSIADDKYLKAASDIGKGIRILRQDPWEMLISFIISQRKSIPSIRSCVEKLCSKFGKVIGKDSGTGAHIYSFPIPENLLAAGSEGLSDCSLGYRLPYVLDAAQKVSSGELDLVSLEELSDDELFEKLKTVKGVGDKVSNCICLFGYGRTGRAPVDVWIKRVIDEQYNGINPFPKYGENAGIMQQYIFYQAQYQKITSL